MILNNCDGPDITYPFLLQQQHYEPLGEVRMSVRPSLLAYLPFTQIIFRQPIPQIFWLMPPMIFFFFKNLVYEGVQHFLDTKYKIIFLL